MQTLHLLASLTRASADARAHALTRSWQSSLSFADSHTYIYSLSLSLLAWDPARAFAAVKALLHTHVHTPCPIHIHAPCPIYCVCQSPAQQPTRVAQRLAISLCPYTRKRQRTRTLSHTITLFHSLSHIHIPSVSLSRTYARANTYAHTLTCASADARALSLTRSLSFAGSLVAHRSLTLDMSPSLFCFVACQPGDEHVKHGLWTFGPLQDTKPRELPTVATSSCEQTMSHPPVVGLRRILDTLGLGP